MVFFSTTRECSFEHGVTAVQALISASYSNYSVDFQTLGLQDHVTMVTYVGGSNIRKAGMCEDAYTANGTYVKTDHPGASDHLWSVGPPSVKRITPCTADRLSYFNRSLLVKL